MECLWCDELFDTIMASCGTGTTWSLFKCPHCKKLTASAIMPGGIIPIEVINDPEIKITKEVKMDSITLSDLLGILNVLNASPSLTELHEELIQLVLKKIKKELGLD